MPPKLESSQSGMLISSIVNGMFTLGIHCAMAKLSRMLRCFDNSKDFSANFMHFMPICIQNGNECCRTIIWSDDSNLLDSGSGVLGRGAGLARSTAESL